MSEADNNDSGLPPKLNLSSKINKADEPAIKLSSRVPDQKTPAPPATGTGTTPAPAIKLTPKAAPKPPTLTAKPVAKSVTPAATTTPKPPTPAVVTPGGKQSTASAPATVRLKARPKPTAAASGSTVSPKPTVTPTTDAPTTAPSSAAPVGKPTLKPKSVKLKPKPAVGIKSKGIDPAAPAGSKRATSKISLTDVENAPTIPDVSINTKTIKIKPSADIKTLSGKIPLTIKQQNPANSAPTPDPKRQTSRISLESALGTSEIDVPDSSTPKTIRLKRPVKSPTVNIESVTADGQAVLSKTSKIEAVDLDNEVPATQKKTIKVKRPSQRRTAKKLSVKRAGEPEAEATAQADEGGIPITPLSDLAPVQAPDTVNWFFIFSAVCSTLIIGVLIYVLSAQDFGPSASLTHLSYGAPGLELPWPGRIPVNQ